MLFWISYLVPMLQLGLISGYYTPDAGRILGPRLLSPVLPLLALPAAFGLSRFPRCGFTLVLISTIFIGWTTAVGAILPLESRHPILDVYLPAFRNVQVSYNLGQAVGCSGLAGTVPLYLFTLLGFAYSWRQLKVARS